MEDKRLRNFEEELEISRTDLTECGGYKARLDRVGKKDRSRLKIEFWNGFDARVFREGESLRFP